MRYCGLHVIRWASAPLDRVRQRSLNTEFGFALASLMFSGPLIGLIVVLIGCHLIVSASLG